MHRIGNKEHYYQDSNRFHDRTQMQVKMNKLKSQSYNLNGWLPQGSILGQLLHVIGKYDVAEEEPQDDKNKYIDNLATLEAVDTEDKLFDYDYWQHVTSNIGNCKKFLAQHTFKYEIINKKSGILDSN